MTEPMHLVRGTLDALIMKAVSAGPLHGYGIADFVHEATRGVLEIEDGALYRALRHPVQRTVQRCTGWRSAAGSRRNGARLRRVVARSSTG